MFYCIVRSVNIINRLLIHFSKGSLLLLLLLSFLLENGFSQTKLERLSLAKRRDDKGFVVRFHLNQSLDSAKVIQSGSNLIQIAAYAKNFELPNLESLQIGSPFAQVEEFEIQNGFGFNFILEPNHFLIADMYLDANKKDWLLGLTIASKRDIDILTEGVTPIDWTVTVVTDSVSTIADTSLSLSPVSDSTQIDTLPEGIDFDFTTLTLDESYNRIKDKSKLDVIVIDPGHGGKDSGTLGFSRTKEKDIALKVALKLGEYIEKNMPEVKVIYTRKDDRFIELEDRGHFANKVEGDLFISIHCNAAKNRSAYGTEVFFLGQHKSEDALDVMLLENSVVRYEENEGESQSQGLTPEQLLIYELSNSGYMADSQLLAEMLDEQFKKRVNRKSRGVKQAGFMVLYYASMPSILVELGFISNKNEEKFLKSEYGQSLMASAIFRAVRDYKEKTERKD
jgi:N-acetylmuramoyl-L-alanine amidase